MMAALPTSPNPPRFRWKQMWVIFVMFIAPGFLHMLLDQVYEVNIDAYTRSARPSPDVLDQVNSTILNSPTHDLANPFRFTFDDTEVSHVFSCPYHF